MNKKLQFQLELIWWIFTAVVVAVVMFPIWRDFPKFPFQWLNIVYIVVAITCARYTFLLKYTFLARIQWVKMLFILLSLLFVGTCMGPMNDFQRWLAESDPIKIFGSVAENRRDVMAEYVKGEVVFFAIFSMVSIVFLNFRLGVSVWRQHNHNTV